ncbi:kinase [Paramagnetospirillum marisnigri]|uniref:Kinase n=1 Tax=Paramagnetospirillum marisnigri TaxID=1285242 RepID=A0A178MDA0_9PROT|nr:kinase [Paramagnetospirillum marisnigri]OAN46739.1 kinase [Paramagnetospirillum marisnigri]
MIISRTPFRVSLFGGGSDYPTWFKQFGGQVVGFAINKYCYITLRSLPPFFAHRHRIAYSQVENVNEISEIQHPAVRAVLAEMGVDSGVEIHHDGDLPARSGMGSSSSFTVGLINTLLAKQGRMATKKQLAEEAIRIEQQVIGENVGSQDQVWAAYGGMNRISFLHDGSFDVAPLIIATERRKAMIGSLMLFFTGFSRFADKVAAKQIANMDNRRAHIHKMAAMVDEAISIMSAPVDRPLDDLGKLLHESWLLKRELADAVSTPEIDEIYQAAMDAGAIGGKLLGAGGGGFMLFYVRPENQAKVRERLKNLIHVDFDVDTSGSKIVVYEPNGLEYS